MFLELSPGAAPFFFEYRTEPLHRRNAEQKRTRPELPGNGFLVALSFCRVLVPEFSSPFVSRFFRAVFPHMQRRIRD